MELEIGMVVEQMKRTGSLVREQPTKHLDRFELTSKQRVLREQVTKFLRVGFVEGDVIGFACGLVDCNLVVAGTAAQFGARPEFIHFGEAAKELMTTALNELSNALTSQDWHTVRVKLAQMETVLYGISVNVGLPYGALLQYLYETYNAEQPVSRLMVADILRKAGMDVALEPGESANDAP